MWSAAYFQYISIALNLSCNKSKLYDTLNYWSRVMLNFYFLEKGLRIVSPPNFMFDFSRKIILLTVSKYFYYSFNWFWMSDRQLKWNWALPAYLQHCFCKYLNRLYHLKFFEGWIPQILLGPFLNTLFFIYGFIDW